LSVDKEISTGMTGDDEKEFPSGARPEPVPPSGGYYYRSDAHSPLKYSSGEKEFDFREVFGR